MVTMSNVGMVRAWVNQRLTAAAEEIFGLFERTIAEHEEERCRLKEDNERQRKLLNAVLKPEVRLHRADVHRLLVVKEEEPPEPPHIKEEPEELWSSQEGEQLQDITKFPFTPVPVKSEDDEEQPQSSQLHHRQTEHMEPAADGEDCGGPEPARNSHPDPHLQPGTEDQPEDSSETEDSVDYSKETREPQSGSKVLKKKGSESDKRRNTGEKRFSCPECGKSLRSMSSVKRHMKSHTGEKPFSCSVCGKRYTRKGTLTQHMSIHTGEKPFGCSICGKRYTQKRTLALHMFIHTGDKPYSCSVCEQRFTWNHQLRSHNCVGLRSSQLHQNQTEENREAEPGASSSTEQINLQMKEEPEELWSSQEGEQLQEITKFPFTPVPVKSEDDEEKPQSSQLHQRQTEHMEPAADGEDCGGPEPARNSHPDPHLQPETEDQPDDSFETEDSVDYSKETREPQSGLKALKNKVSESDERPKTKEKRFSCPECQKSFRCMQSVNRHMKSHTGEKPFSCSVCGQSFKFNDSVKMHMRIHTGEKPFSCSVCRKRFTRKDTLTQHMSIHTGEKPFSCSVCRKRFGRKRTLTQHMSIHTGDNLYSCSVCEQRFTWNHQLRSHKCVGRQSSQLHQNQTEENRETEPGASSSTEQINLQMKEEPEELWSSQEGEQLQNITKFPFTPVPVKSEDAKERAQSSP